ncbi:MAG: hypothetical protein ACOH1E_06070 [Brevundimonas sp.]
MTMSDYERNTPGRHGGWRLRAWGAVAALWLLPLAAMQMTDEVAWTLSDFATFGALLLGAGLLFELVLWKVRSPFGRIAIGAMIAAAFLLIWADGAVGIF